MCDDSDSDEMFDELSDDFLEAEVETEIEPPRGAPITSLPEKSKKLYEKVYNRFMDWCEKNEVKPFTESGLLTYFNERPKDLKSSSLWAEYSMMKATLAIRHDVDIKKFSKVKAFLKSRAVGYQPKLSKAFTREEIYKFVKEAPNAQYLMLKIVAVVGIAGACKIDELYSITTDCIEEFGPLLRIKIPLSSKTKERSFVVCGEQENLGIPDMCRKYAALRPDHTEHNNFFINYRNGKCSVQVVGKNTLGKAPSQIARYLQLESPSEYTGHCFRRSSAALYGDNRQDIANITRELPCVPAKALRLHAASEFDTATSSNVTLIERCDTLLPAREMEDEFSYFGRNIACQLRQLPLEDALQCQSEIMNIISQKRLLLLYGKHEEVNIKSSPGNILYSNPTYTEHNY